MVHRCILHCALLVPRKLLTPGHMCFQGWPMDSDWLMLEYKEPACLPRFETTLKGHLSSRVSHRMAEASVIITRQASSSLPSPAFLGSLSSSANTPLNTFCTQLSELVFPRTPIWDTHLTHFFQKPLFFFFLIKASLREDSEKLIYVEVPMVNNSSMGFLSQSHLLFMMLFICCLHQSLDKIFRSQGSG